MPASPDHSPLNPPDVADLVLDFVNTNAQMQPEQLGSAAELRAWLEQAGFRDLDVTDADAAAARELRDAIQTVMLFHAGGEDPDSAAMQQAEQCLQRAAVRHPVQSVITGNGVILRPAQTEIPGVFGTIIAAVAELALTGSWERMKACRNPPCHGGFYDRTRNGSAAYHAATCGSQVSMRAYRQRKKDEEAT